MTNQTRADTVPYTGLWPAMLTPLDAALDIDIPAFAAHAKKTRGVELNPDYFRDGVGYLESADAEKDAPTLFDLLENGA